MAIVIPDSSLLIITVLRTYLRGGKGLCNKSLSG
jgi:hypothetical protein